LGPILLAKKILVLALINAEVVTAILFRVSIFVPCKLRYPSENRAQALVRLGFCEIPLFIFDYRNFWWMWYTNAFAAEAIYRIGSVAFGASGTDWHQQNCSLVILYLRKIGRASCREGV